jgi:hypothetical protein
MVYTEVTRDMARLGRAEVRRSAAVAVPAEVSVLARGDLPKAAEPDRAGALAASLVVDSGSGSEQASSVSRSAGYCGVVVVVDRVVVPAPVGSVSVFEWVSELPVTPCS